MAGLDHGMGTAEVQAAEVGRLLDAARMAFAQYRNDDGAAHLDAASRAAEAVADLSAHVGIRLGITRTWLTFERHGLETAEAELQDVRQASERADLPALIALCDAQQATLRMRSGDLTTALAALHRAERHRHALTPDDQVRILLNRGALAIQTLDLDAARADLAEAASTAVGPDLAPLRFKALHNQGCAEFYRGNIPAALALMHAAAAHTGAMNTGLTLVDRARVLVEAGLLREARSALLEAATRYADAGLLRDVSEIHVDLARCELLIGEVTSAAERARHAAAVFHDRGEPYWEHRARLVQITALGLAGAPAPADRIQQARDLLGAVAGRGDVATTNLVRVELALALCDLASVEALADARALLVQAQGLARSPHLASRLGYSHARARIDLAIGSESATAARLARAAEDLAGAQRRTAGLDARTALAVHARRLADLDVDLALRRGDPVAVLHRMERWRRAVTPLTPLSPAADPDEALLRAQLRRAREALSQGAPGGLGELRSNVRRLERATSAARWRAAITAPAHAGSPPTYAQVRAALSTADGIGAAVLGLVVMGGAVRAVVATPGARATIVDLGPSTALWRLIDRVVADVDSAARAAGEPRLGPMIAAAAQESVGALDRALRPALADAEGSPAVVLAGELFGAIPWGLLPSRRGLPTTLAPSLLAWAAFAEPGRDGPAGPASAATAGGGTGAMGATGPTADVVLPAGGEAALDPPADMSVSGAPGRPPGRVGPPPIPRVAALAGPGVAHGAAEVASVLGAWSAEAAARVADPGRSVREAPCASRTDLLDALTSADLVHVAAHGDHQPESPLFSSLRLVDGLVFAHELQTLPPAASLVVLSACDAGRGTARPGEEALGWPSALLALGVRTVVAPLVAVRDDETYAVMSQLHRGLAAGLPADAALAAAAGPTGTPFVCFGAPWEAKATLGGDGSPPDQSTQSSP